MFDNSRLVDILNRHQIYLEGVKTFQREKLFKRLEEVKAGVLALLSSLQITSFDQLAKYELILLQKQLKTIQGKFYDELTQELIADLKALLSADLLVSKIIFGTIQQPEGKDEKPISEADATGDLLDASENDKTAGLLPFSALTGSEEGNNKLWSFISNTPIPANGINLIPFINGFGVSATNSIINAVNKGYANSSNLQDVINELFGTKANNYKDGQFNRINIQSGAMSDTAMQFVSAITQSAVAAEYFEKYMWGSVIDGRTSAICRSLNGRIYYYGKGPLPPAHINCRSKAIPLTPEDENDAELVGTTFYSWLQRQPEDFRNDWLAMERFKSNNKEFTGVKSLTLNEFRSKVKLMLIR